MMTNKTVDVLPRRLRGMTWLHDRGLAPLVATAQTWERRTGVEVIWDARSLKAFGEVPLSDLVGTYDLLVIDHPFIGRAVAGDLLAPLDELVGDDYLRSEAANSVGGSHESYQWQGRQYALAVDAAAQVLAARVDLLGEMPVPRTWSDVAALSGHGIGMPMNVTDVVPTFLSLCGSFGETPLDGRVVSTDHGLQVLVAMRELASAAIPWTLDYNPIELLERMSTGDEVAIIPAVFGYTNYSRAGYRTHLVSFADLPRVLASGPPRGSTLGGAGLAVSARSDYKAEAAAYAAFVAAGDTQASQYVASGGQPAHRQAWEDHDADASTGRFFSGTRTTMDHAFVRPRHAGYLDWQDAAGPVLAGFVRGDGKARQVLNTLEQIYRSSLGTIQPAHHRTAFQE